LLFSNVRTSELTCWRSGCPNILHCRRSAKGARTVCQLTFKRAALFGRPNVWAYMLIVRMSEYFVLWTVHQGGVDGLTTNRNQSVSSARMSSQWTVHLGERTVRHLTETSQSRVSKLAKGWHDDRDMWHAEVAGYIIFFF